jgi:hypothetical protein
MRFKTKFEAAACILLSQPFIFGVLCLQVAVNDKQERRYTPKLKIVIPDRPNILLDGAINLTPKKYDIKLALRNAFRDPITTDGE